MNKETNNIVQGLLFLSTKFPDGKVKSMIDYISFLLPKDYTPLEIEDITYIESLGWDECDIDLCGLFSQTWVATAWVFDIKSIEEEFEEDE